MPTNSTAKVRVMIFLSFALLEGTVAGVAIVPRFYFLGLFAG
jgi:hypothetical protein